MNSQQQDATMLDEIDVPAVGMDAPYSFGDRDDLEYLDQCSALFENLFGSPGPEIGHIFDPLNDTGDLSEIMRTEPFASDTPILADNLVSIIPNPIPFGEGDVVGETSETTQPAVHPQSADGRHLFVSPTDLLLNAPQEQVEAPIADVSIVQYIPDRSLQLSEGTANPWLSASRTDQDRVWQNMEIESFEALLMDMDLPNPFPTSVESFSQALAHQLDQYPTSLSIPPMTASTVFNPQVTALDGSELRELSNSSGEQSSRPQPKTRRKRTIKAPVKSNNPYGRGGTWACRLCRDRRWKCVYSSFNETCQVCRDRNRREPCVKITAAEYDPSRVVRGGNGTCKNDSEQMLLDFAYSDRFAEQGHTLAAILRSLAAVFGNVPRHSVLLHSILAVSAASCPSREPHEFECHLRLTIRGLKTRLKSQKAFSEADAFAAFFYVMWPGRLDIVVIDSLLEFSYQSLFPSESIKIFPVFAPVVIQVIKWVITRVSGKLWLESSLMQTSGRIMNWAERYKREAELNQLLWRTTRVNLSCLTLETVEDLLQNAWACLYAEVTKSSCLDRARSFRYEIKQALNDPKFQYLLEAQQSDQIPCLSSDGQLILFATLGKYALDGVITILEAATVTSGLAKLEESPVPTNLLRMCWEMPLLPSSIFAFQYIPRIAVIFGACTISAIDLPTWQLAVVEFLRVRRREKLIDLLSKFWVDRNMENLGRVLEEALTGSYEEDDWYDEKVRELSKSDGETDTEREAEAFPI